MSEAILSVLEFDMIQAVGASKLSAGQASGCVAAIHALSGLFNKRDTKAILLIDASNAFNSLTRHKALLSIPQLCPPFPYLD